MINYKNIENILILILESNPETRDSDELLYIEYCKKIDPSILDEKFEDVMSKRYKYGIKSLESVGRSRRKIQSMNPHLQSSRAAEKDKFNKMIETIEYAKN